MYEETPDEKVKKILLAVSEEQHEKILHLFEEIQVIMKNNVLLPETIAAVFREAIDKGYSSLNGFLNAFVASNEPLVLCALIEYLVCFDNESLSLYMGKFLKKNNVRVKSTALRALLKIDPRSALKQLISFFMGVKMTVELLLIVFHSLIFQLHVTIFVKFLKKLPTGV